MSEPEENANKITREMTTSGMLIAQAMLLTMAVVPIYIGSLASVKQKAKIEKMSKEERSKLDIEDGLTSKDAMMFPITASCTLFGLYIIIKKVDPTYLNALLGVYFMLAGVYTITSLLVEIPTLKKLFPSCFHSDNFQLTFKQNEDTQVDWKFTYIEIAYVIIATGKGYKFSNHSPSEIFHHNLEMGNLQDLFF